MKFRTTTLVGLIMAMMISSASLGAATNHFKLDNQRLPTQNSQEVIVTFDSSVPSGQLIRVVQELNVVPREIYYGTGAADNASISGGYTLSEEESINSALESMREKHITFLRTAIGSNKEQLKAETDQVALNGTKSLNKQFRKLLKEAEGADVELSGLRLRDATAVSALAEKIQVRNVESVPSKRRIGGDQSESEDVSTQSYRNESWAPYYGTSAVTQRYTYQTFYFNNTSGFGGTSTYEHETQIYNRGFASYGYYWSSNMPSAYYDTPVTDSIFNPTVGTSQASWLRAYSYYYTYMALNPGWWWSATVKIKGQKGHRFPSWCHSTWCVWPDATTAAMLSFTAPSGTRQYWY